MFGTTVRCCSHIKHVTGTHFDISYNLKSVVAGFGNQKAFYASDKKGCSKERPRTEGRQVEDWPSNDPEAQMWRPECNRDPCPINDPYRIKVPDIVVPPLKGAPAQWTGVVLTAAGAGGRKDPPLQNEGYQQDYQNQPGAFAGMPSQSQTDSEDKDETFLGMLKNLLKGGKKDKTDQMISTDDELLKLQFQYLRDDTQKQ